jgi:hypothetical protein
MFFHAGFLNPTLLSYYRGIIIRGEILTKLFKLFFFVVLCDEDVCTCQQKWQTVDRANIFFANIKFQLLDLLNENLAILID